jgi:DNA-directed RNA polymerase subunit RPC12/RpoP
MNDILDSERVEQFQAVLKLRETEDLLALWRANDQEEWTPEAFEAMRLILRERLHEEPARVDDSAEDTAYFCSECGAEVAFTDKFCRECGASVEDIKETGEGSGTDSEPLLTPLALEFFAEATRLPTAYVEYFVFGAGNRIVIPEHEPKIGDLIVQLLPGEIQVTVGDHTELVFFKGSEAVQFIEEILTDESVFRFDGEAVELEQASEMTEEEMLDRKSYVWSGPLRDQQRGE